MAAASQYPSPYPAFTEQYADGTTSAQIYGTVKHQTMACWTGGPSPAVTPLAMPQVYPKLEHCVVGNPQVGAEGAQRAMMAASGFEDMPSGDPSTAPSYASLPMVNPDQKVQMPPVHYQVGASENYMLNMVPGNSFMMPNTNAVGGPDGAMQAFQYHFGPEFSFFNGVEGAGMPQGFHAALAAQNQGAVGAPNFGGEAIRKAVRKVDPPTPAVAASEPKETPTSAAHKARSQKRKLICC
ncbi:hypothetical protein TGME49_235690 [Toxoplasma gondii ME49]|uniref:Uncharacterized protein n=3 Tax=Toxoplasma gondii TaxID=5811 RepID=A0A2G8XWS8_TOXGO|nr:hypothetical protein TGME49_235690 [Toxoplasma gondii ME49]EPT26714.1 hypothetical protein TGME49_235690 [Toxoplasma gondii ME49]KFG31582.1 hypothetical protein TGDOM2_235690 [Toxoplasma gondii GAB2-2007-GAL-DOM2]PIL99476.1 hypothetical protein TGCOUG_235690 [Toxoplasma gondii COUG]|eukprot:XP_002368964.1 hypothetical protein TGME49_235690 [Toxoplasma gondii ME49]